MKRAWIFIVAAACTGDASGGSVEGPKIFDAMCSSCHGPTGKPTAAMIARLSVRDLTDPALRARLTPAIVEQQIRAGSANKLMPSFTGALTDAQITALSAYITSPAFLKR